MILIQLLLILAFVAALLKFLVNPGSHHINAWKKIIGTLLMVLAIFAVLFPNTLSTLANYVGVGRGADLLLYILALSFTFLAINLYVRGKQDEKRFAKVVRKLAILEAEKEAEKKNEEASGTKR